MAGYQFRARNAAEPGWVGYDDSYDQDTIGGWCADQSVWAEGYYPEMRSLYGGAWRPVDPENPPAAPPGGWYVPRGP